MYAVDIDVGGTLTDGLFSDGKSVVPVKVDTTPHDLTVCLFDCLNEGARALGFAELSSFLEHVEAIRWSTTVTSNVLAEKTGPKLGLFVSAGQANNLYGESRSPAVGTLVDEQNISVLAQPLDDAEILKAVRRLLEYGVRRVCVSLRGGFYDSKDEKAIQKLIEGHYPDHALGSVPVLVGSDICKHPDDMTRTHYALINAYVHAPLATSVFKAEDELRYTYSYNKPLLIGHNNGGAARISKTRAIDTLESGPIFGVFASAYYAKKYGLGKVIAFDVGGTTTKMGIIVNGEPLLTRDGDMFGIPIRTPTVMLRSIALGGGSVVRVDGASKQLRIGPDSMGAYPGPACYDLGGEEATLTDAFVTLGLINPDYFLGGTKKLNRGRAREALGEQVAGPLGLSVEQAANLVLKGSFQTVGEAIVDTLEAAKLNPRDFALFAFGGNGAIFACGVAEKAGIERAYAFSLGSVFSAFGSSIADIAHVYEHALLSPLQPQADVGKINAVLDSLREEALRDMLGEGLDVARMSLSLTFEVGDGQNAPVTIYVPFTRIEGQGELNTILDYYDKLAPTSYSRERVIVDLARLRATYPVAGFEPAQQAPTEGRAEDAIKEQRAVFWTSVASATNVYDWDALRCANVVKGPAIAEGRSTTYVVSPSWELRIDDYLNGVLTKRGE